MTPFIVLTSRVVPLVADDVDTDQIIPAQLVNSVGQAALARALFARLRERDPPFVLDRPGMPGRSIMLVGSNFGCGSSREAAVWALAAWGVRAIVGRSFNATFHANCLQNGVLPVAAPPEHHARLVAAVERDRDLEITIDLPADRVCAGAIEIACGIEPFARSLLVSGKDELQYLLDRADAITEHEGRNP